MKNRWSIRTRVLIALALAAAVIHIAVYIQTFHGERGSVDVYTRRVSEFPALARLTHQQVVDLVRRAAPGRLLGIRLREVNKTLLYEVEWVAAEGGSVWMFRIDAGDGAILARRQIQNTRHIATR